MGALIGIVVGYWLLKSVKWPPRPAVMAFATLLGVSGFIHLGLERSAVSERIAAVDLPKPSLLLDRFSGLRIGRGRIAPDQVWRALRPALR